MKHNWPAPKAPPNLKAGEVHLWKAHLGSGIIVDERILSEDESQRMQRYRFAEDRQRFVLARILLRRLLGSYLKRPPEQLKFSYTAHGKPHLPHRTGEMQIQFNLTHAGDNILLAFTRDIPVGVDVERIKPLPELEVIARRFFSAGEHRDLSTLTGSEKTTAFYRCWTRKEAVIKACGEGLSMPLDSFQVSLLPTEPARLLHSPGDSPWMLLDITPEAGYAAAFAAPVATLQVQYYSAEML